MKPNLFNRDRLCLSPDRTSERAGGSDSVQWPTAAASEDVSIQKSKLQLLMIIAPPHTHTFLYLPPHGQTSNQQGKTSKEAFILKLSGFWVPHRSAVTSDLLRRPGFDLLVWGLKGQTFLLFVFFYNPNVERKVTFW